MAIPQHCCLGVAVLERARHSSSLRTAYDYNLHQIGFAKKRSKRIKAQANDSLEQINYALPFVPFDLATGGSY
jgi:hypothetical protein